MGKLNLNSNVDIPKINGPLNLDEFGTITIPLWMRTRLDLKQNELLLCAIIFSFSQDGSSEFYGSRKYLSDVLGCSIDTIDRTLKKLMDKDIINKRVEDINGVKFPRYSFNFNCITKTAENNIPLKSGTGTRNSGSQALNSGTIYINNINNNNNNINNIVPENQVPHPENEKTSKEVFNQLKSKKGTKYSTKNVIDELFSHYEELYNCKYPESNFSKLTVQIQKLQEDYGCTLNELSTKIIEWMDYWKSSDWQQEDGNFILPTAVWVRNKLDSKVPKNGNSKKTTYDIQQSNSTYKSNNRRMGEM